VDKLESQLATGHVGPFLFTKLLTPKLLASATASYTPRVVFVSSFAHTMGTGVNLTTLKHPDPEKYNAQETYSQVKSANILTTIELAKRSKGKINAYSLHPGGTFPPTWSKAN
jgi:NAD(P)-dependent dehydrogenase (short-subunit alcohol dehydrogenase family)